MESNSSESKTDLVELEFEEVQEVEPEDRHTQALSSLKFLYEAVKGAWVQSVLTRPPLVAQSSAFQRLEYILMGRFFGYGTPIDSMFLNSLMGVPSTDNLTTENYNLINLNSSNKFWFNMWAILYYHIFK